MTVSDKNNDIEGNAEVAEMEPINEASQSEESDYENNHASSHRVSSGPVVALTEYAASRPRRSLTFRS